MALIDSAVNGLAGAVVSGLVAGALWWTGRGRRAQLDDVWRKQAEELDERITKQNADEKRQLRTEIAYLRKELEKCQADTRRNWRRGND